MVGVHQRPARPRILLITSSGPLDGDGGSATTSEVWSAISDFEVHLLCMRNRSPRPECFEPRSGERICLHRGPPVDRFPQLLSDAQQALETFSLMAAGLDLVVALHMSKAFFAPAWDILGLPLVIFPLYTSHSYRDQGEIVPEAYLAAERAAIRAATRLVTPSALEAGQLRDLGAAADRLTILPRDVPTPRGDVRPPRAPGDPFTLVSVGALRRQKNHEDSLHVLGALRDGGIFARLLIVGPEQDHAYAAELAATVNALDIAAMVEFLAVRPAEMAGIFARAHLALGLSHHETFGRAIIEGIAHGVPTLIYDDLVAPLAELTSSPGVATVPRRRDALVNEVVRRTAETSADWNHRSREASRSVRLGDRSGYLERIRNVILGALDAQPGQL